MDVLVTGSHGMIGTALIPRLRARGDHVLRLVRSAPEGSDDVRWDPPAGTVDAAALEGVDAVVHLAGAGIGDKKWTDARKRLVLESRTQPTGLLARTLAALDRKPHVLVSASAIGFYGDRGPEVLTEDSSSGTDFGARVCEAWEDATTPAASAGIRVVRIRSGLVLASQGGLLKRLLLPFRLGIGGRLGSGDQYMSWIALDDELRAILHVVDNGSLAGALNLTAPNPVTNRQFTEALGRAVHRPTIIPTPLLGLKAVYGGELVETLLGSQRVSSTKLQSSGFEFTHPHLDAALDDILRST
ncbi:MAG TPA: TIGR01777 family oxidoreductase [Acidimicrobiia bacterium]|jgi:hypothetical protein